MERIEQIYIISCAAKFLRKLLFYFSIINKYSSRLFSNEYTLILMIRLIYLCFYKYYIYIYLNLRIYTYSDLAKFNIFIFRSKGNYIVFEVLQEIAVKLTLIGSIRMKHLKFLGPITRKEDLQNLILTGDTKCKRHKGKWCITYLMNIYKQLADQSLGECKKNTNFNKVYK